MAFYQKATKGRSPGYHTYTNKDIKRVDWCISRNIKIAVIPNETEWQVEININKKIHSDPKIYNAREATEKMYEYYKYYYDKYRNEFSVSKRSV